MYLAVPPSVFSANVNRLHFKSWKFGLIPVLGAGLRLYCVSRAAPVPLFGDAAALCQPRSFGASLGGGASAVLFKPRGFGASCCPPGAAYREATAHVRGPLWPMARSMEVRAALVVGADARFPDAGGGCARVPAQHSCN